MKAIDRSRHCTGFVPECRDVDQRRDAGTVRTLDDNLSVAHRLAGSQDIGHRAFNLCKRLTIGLIQPMSPVKPLRWIANFRRATPKLYGASIIPNDFAIAVTDVHGGG